MTGTALAAAAGVTTTPHPEPAVSLREVFCVHRTPEGDAAALQGTTFAVARGEVVCVLGPSGAGKSTLLRVIAGLQTPSAGDARVLGRDIGRLPARARARLRQARIGFLAQSPSSVISPDLRVADAVALPLALRGVRRAQREARVRDLLHRAGLEQRARALPTALSGGERQRVALCAALAHGPELLLADEPTGELDAGSADEVRNLIVELCRAQGATAILVSHDHATAAVADRALRIRDGRVVEDRREGEDAIVVGRGGWVRLPPELLARAGIGDRARVTLGDGGVVVSAAAPPAGHAEAAPAPGHDGEAAPAPGHDGETEPAPGHDGETAPAPGHDGETAPARGHDGEAAPAGGYDGETAPARGYDGQRRLSTILSTTSAPEPARPSGGVEWAPAAVELRELSRGYGRRAVIDRLTLAPPLGQMTVITGRSGSGKTTLLRLLAGLDRPDSGQLLIDGEPADQDDAERRAARRRRLIGYLPQEPSPVSFMSAEENVALALQIRGWDSEPARERATVVLAQIGLADRARQRVARLSAGEAQRVALARALASARGLLIADEPTSRLDETNAVAVAELLRAAAADDAQTVICATHDPEVIARADHVVSL